MTILDEQVVLGSCRGRHVRVALVIGPLHATHFDIAKIEDVRVQTQYPVGPGPPEADGIVGVSDVRSRAKVERLDRAGWGREVLQATRRCQRGQIVAEGFAGGWWNFRDEAVGQFGREGWSNGALKLLDADVPVRGLLSEGTSRQLKVDGHCHVVVGRGKGHVNCNGTKMIMSKPSPVIPTRQLTVLPIVGATQMEIHVLNRQHVVDTSRVRIGRRLGQIERVKV